MKIYRAWTDSMHAVQYTLGYFEREEDAKKFLPELTTAGPNAGVEEINVIPHTLIIEQKERLIKGNSI
jgi:hypothetical protein